MIKYRDRDIVEDMFVEGGKDLTYALFKAKEEILRKHDEERREKELEERLFKRLMDRIQVEVMDEAGPVIKELDRQIRSLGK